MTEIEKDFIEFVAHRNNETIEATRARYEASKGYMNFGTKEFSAHGSANQQILQVFFNDQSEKSLFESYRFYAYEDILRMLSYSFEKPATTKGYVKTLVRAVRQGDWSKITSFLSRWKKHRIQGEKKLSKAEWLLGAYSAPTVLDYGCGIAQLSFDMAKLSPESKIILVDLDTVKLDFAEFRFKKHGINHEILRIQEDNQYPELPKHTICIATDVLEHLHKPLVAYAHIRDSMEQGGVLYGNFEDHHHEMFHVHADMEDVREAVAQDYDEVDRGLYQKR